MRREKTNAGKIGLLVALIVAVIGGISFGYAKLSETLTITGTAKIKKVQWNVNLQNLVLDESNTVMESLDTKVEIKDSATDTNPKETITFAKDNDDNVVGTVTKRVTTGGIFLQFDVTLSQPGQKLKYSFDVANDGTLDAVLKSIEEDGTLKDSVETSHEEYVTKTGGQQASEPYFRYTITGMPTKGSALNSGDKKTVTVTLEYPDLTDAESLYNGDSDFTFSKTIKLNYEQK